VNIESHLRNFKESVDVINESIEKGIVERQRNIGFNTSAACADLFEMILHKRNLIDAGFIVKHEWFNSKRKIEEKLNFDIPNKDKILKIISFIEKKRNLLCYGKPKKEETIEEVIKKFNDLKKIFRESGLNEIK